MSIVVQPSGQACGAAVTGVDLRAPLDAAVVAEIRAAWLQHQVLSFPNQKLTDDDLERFSRYFGEFGEDPFIQPIAGREHILAVKRLATEQGPIFAEAWHTDWSFQALPPAGTCLFGITVPPSGGDTLFANQQLALEAMPAELRARIDGLQARHSAEVAYAPEGLYGETDRQQGRSMDILTSEEAKAAQLHPLVRRHRETGREAVYGCFGYIVGIEGMAQAEATELLLDLYTWQTQEQFQYRHRWQADTLLMWDNRAVLHMATGGYEGHDRLLHRTTIADERA